MLTATIFAAIALVGDPWVLRDVTDNLTGEREVGAIQISDNKIQGRAVGLHISCIAGHPTFRLFWNGPMGNEYALVGIKRGTPGNLVSLGPPIAWEMHRNSRDVVTAPFEEAARVVNEMNGGDQIIVQHYDREIESMAVFDADGLAAAFEYVGGTCVA